MPGFLRLVIPAVLLGLAACTSPSRQIADSLVGYGVPPRQAECMGNRLGQRLSLAQLRRLREIGRAGRLDRPSLRQIAERLNDPRDPELVAEFLRAGLGCVI
jgi:hypothetical protein